MSAAGSYPDMGAELERATVLAAGPFDPARWYKLATAEGMQVSPGPDGGLWFDFQGGRGASGRVAMAWLNLAVPDPGATVWDWLRSDGHLPHQ